MIPNKHKQRYIESLKTNYKNTYNVSDEEIEKKLKEYNFEEAMIKVPDVIMHFDPSVWARMMYFNKESKNF